MEGGQWIADRLEATSETKISAILRCSGSSPEDHLAFTKDFAPRGMIPAISPMPGATNFSVGNDLTIQYKMAPDEFIFCASFGELDDLTQTMCEGSDPKDACIEITDFELLIHRCFYRGRVLETGERPNKHFSTFRFAPVKYASLSVAAGASMEVPSPFTKDVLFAAQREVRIVLTPLDQKALPPTVTIKVPRMRVLLREIFRNRTSAIVN
jgi:hypothetical protein